MPSRVESLDVAGPAGSLETLIDAPPDGVRAVALLCHPHPLQQGTMHNKVVFTLARCFVRLGAAAVRFNFRGVGGSQGAHSGAGGEVDDALAVARWIETRWSGMPLYLGGFSFGAAIVLQAARSLRPAGIVTVAPAVQRLDAQFAAPPCPWLLVHGSEDEVVPAEAVTRWLAGLERQPELAMLEGAGHFFHGRLTQLGDVVARFFASDPVFSAERRRAQGAE